MLIKKCFLIFSIFVCVSVFAQTSKEQSCKSSKPRLTPFGEVYKTECGTATSGHKDTIYVKGVPVLSDTRLFNDDSNDRRTMVVYSSGANNPETGCAPRLYLLDISTTPVNVIAFGVKSACNEFHWASWGEKRSVIALKKNVKFVYENGKLIPPTKGEALFNAIEPPHSSVGGGMDVESAIPFVEQVPLPK